MPIVCGWMNADGTSEIIQLRCEAAYDREAAFKITKQFERLLRELKVLKSQSQGQNKQDEYA